jgi:hypothetical protein
MRSPGDAPPGLPRAPDAPTIPALGAGSASFAFFLLSMTALALLLSGAMTRSGTARRIDFAGGRPANFALLLERPG